MTKEIKKLNFTSVGDGYYELEVEEVGQIGKIELELEKKDKIRVNFWLEAEPYNKLKFIARESNISLTEIIKKLIYCCVYVENDE